MVGLLIVLLVIAGVAVSVATLITLVQYAMFLSQAIQVANWGPDWLNGGGFTTGLFAFVVIIVGIVVVGIICRIAYTLLYSLLALPLLGATSMSKRMDYEVPLAILALVMGIAWFIVSIYLTHELLTYTESVGYVKSLNSHAIFAWIGTLVTINGLAFSSSSHND